MSDEEAPMRFPYVENFFDQLKKGNFGPSLIMGKENEHLKDSNLLTFERHFSADLPTNSDYFKSMQDMFKCVNKHADKELSESDMQKVCAKEYKQLRLTAFDNKVMYHYINKNHFMNELSLFRHEAPY